MGEQPAATMALLAACLRRDPKRRPSIDALLAHPLLARRPERTRTQGARTQGAAGGPSGAVGREVGREVGRVEERAEVEVAEAAAMVEEELPVDKAVGDAELERVPGWLRDLLEPEACMLFADTTERKRPHPPQNIGEAMRMHAHAFS